MGYDTNKVPALRELIEELYFGTKQMAKNVGVSKYNNISYLNILLDS